MKEKKYLYGYLGTCEIMTVMLFTNMFTAMANKITPKNFLKMKIRFSPKSLWILSSWLITM